MKSIATLEIELQAARAKLAALESDAAFLARIAATKQAHQEAEEAHKHALQRYVLRFVAAYEKAGIHPDLSSPEVDPQDACPEELRHYAARSIGLPEDRNGRQLSGRYANLFDALVNELEERVLSDSDFMAARADVAAKHKALHRAHDAHRFGDAHRLSQARGDVRWLTEEIDRRRQDKASRRAGINNAGALLKKARQRLLQIERGELTIPLPCETANGAAATPAPAPEVA